MQIRPGHINAFDDGVIEARMHQVRLPPIGILYAAIFEYGVACMQALRLRVAQITSENETVADVGVLPVVLGEMALHKAALWHRRVPD